MCQHQDNTFSSCGLGPGILEEAVILCAQYFFFGVAVLVRHSEEFKHQEEWTEAMG